MEKTYIVIESHTKNEFESILNAYYDKGYELISHALAVDADASPSVANTYSGVLVKKRHF